MVLQSLRKTVDFYKQKLDSITDVNTQQLEQLKDLPFYDWSLLQKAEEGAAFTSLVTPRTFNHAIGLPQKNGQSYPLFDYEELLFDILQKHKHVWIKKATGLGVTEFLLRYMAWLCFQQQANSLLDNSQAGSLELQGSQMCIVTGPRIELAITLIDRMKGLFGNLGSQKSFSQMTVFDTKETVI
jgi:hypothetical protein